VRFASLGSLYNLAMQSSETRDDVAFLKQRDDVAIEAIL